MTSSYGNATSTIKCVNSKRFCSEGNFEKKIYQNIQKNRSLKPKKIKNLKFLKL